MIGDYSSGQIDYYNSNKVLTKSLKGFHSKKINFLKYLSNGMVASSSSDAKINIWETTWWTSIQIYKGHSFPIPVFDLDLINNDTIASSSWDGTIHIWKISTGQTLRKINIGNSLYSMKVLSDGFQLAYSLFGSTLRITNYTTGHLVERSRLVISLKIL